MNIYQKVPSRFSEGFDHDSLPLLVCETSARYIYGDAGSRSSTEMESSHCLLLYDGHP